MKDNENILRVALVQHSCSEDRGGNLRQTIDGLRQAAGAGARLVLLQELHTCPYFCQRENARVFDLAEPVPGPTTSALGEVARELRIVVVASLFERRASGVYHNTAVVIEADGGIAGRYRKMHIPDDPGYYEKYYFTPGDLGFEPIDTSVGRLGVLVCWDQWFPEAARLMALSGADLLLYPTAIGWSAEDDQAEQNLQRDAWTTVQRGHAIANGLPLMACNRTGFEPDPAAAGDGVDFWGSSFVCGPQGEVLAQSPTDRPDVLVTDIDLGRSEGVRRVWPYFRDRRVDAYDDLLRRFRD
jgi:N-carbamoylputrescine amidase